MLDEKEVDLLTTAFENLHMMLRAIYEQGIDPEFDKGITHPSHNQPGIVFNMLDRFVERYGKPSEILICDEALKGILTDVCKKAGIKLTVKKRLSAVNNARNKLLSQL